MSRVRWKVLVAMLAVVFVTIGLSALFARRVTLAEIHRLQMARQPPQDLGALEEHHRTHGGWSDVERTLDAMPSSLRIVLTNTQRQVIAVSKDVRGMAISVDTNNRVVITGRGLGFIVQVPPLRVGDAYAYVLPERDPLEDTPGVTPLDRGLLFTFAGATVVAMVLAFVVSRRITIPMERLTAAVDAMARGARPDRVPVTGRDEIARLAESFNAMADALARQEELRRRMVSDVAHELRTPLTNLRGELEAIQDGLVSPNAARIASIHEEVLHLERIVADLQDLAIADAGGLHLRRERLDLASTVARIVDAFSASASASASAFANASGAPRIELSCDTPQGEEVCVLADPVRIGQIVRNLLSNALRHARSVVRVRVARGEREATVTVTDDGPGIPAEHLSRVFERFYRIDDARSREAGGAGLGLAIVKQMVELHDGRVWAQNAPAGSGLGAMITFTLPFISDS